MNLDLPALEPWFGEAMCAICPKFASPAPAAGNPWHPPRQVCADIYPTV